MQVTDNDEVFNIFMPDTGHPDKIKSKYLGSLNDLETVKVDAVAGIPFRRALAPCAARCRPGCCA